MSKLLKVCLHKGVVLCPVVWIVEHAECIKSVSKTKPLLLKICKWLLLKKQKQFGCCLQPERTEILYGRKMCVLSTSAFSYCVLNTFAYDSSKLGVPPPPQHVIVLSIHSLFPCKLLKKVPAMYLKNFYKRVAVQKIGHSFCHP